MWVAKLYFIEEFENFDELFRGYSNSLISRDESNNFWFYNQYAERKEPMRFELYGLVFDEQLAIELRDKVMPKALEKASTLSLEPIKKRPDIDIANCVPTFVLGASYDNQTSVFALCAYIFAMMLMEHALINGNKRVSFSFLIGALRYFGFHFSKTRGQQEDYKFYEEKVASFVDYFQNKNGVHNNAKFRQGLERVEQWIRKNVVIAIPQKVPRKPDRII